MTHRTVYLPGPQTTATLDSVEYVRILDVVCEGEIEGLVGGAQSIYINGVPAQNPDIINGDIVTEGSSNFEEVEFTLNTGEQNQEYIKGFAASEAEKSISNSEVLKDTTVTVQTESSLLTSVRVNMRIPRLTNTSSDGTVNGTTVKYEIGLQSASSGTFVTQREGIVPNRFSRTTPTTGTTSASAIGIEGVVAWGKPREFLYFDDDLGEDVFAKTSIAYDLEYRISPSGDWIKITRVSRSGDADGSVTATYNATNYGRTPLGSPGGQFYFLDLPKDAYDIRITNITGSTAPWGYGTVAFAYLYEWLETETVTIVGKSTVAFTKSHIIDLTQPGLNDGPWQIRVTRITDDSNDDLLSNKTFFDSITEIIDHKLSYPNTAYIGVVMDSTQFSSVPARGYELKLLKVKVPSNYDPITRVYTGMWDGTFKAEKEWTDNPAWCFYDLITNSRYGLGNFLNESTHVDKSSLYTIGQYCDEEVRNGAGYLEPRFTCNLYLQNREQAYKVLKDMASIFRGMMYWTNNQVTPVQDSPTPVIAQFSNADVVEGDFIYEGSSARTRHTVALVTWNDPANAYKQVIEYVEDSSGVALRGILETEVQAVGCTSRGQAYRVGRWLLYSERYETETVNFKAGLEGTQIFPGDIIKTSDQHRVGARHGGRITGVTASTITLDSPLTIGSGTETITNVLSDGTLVDSTINETAGTYTTIQITPSFTTQPVVNSLWVVAANSVTPEEWRVVGVTEEEKNIYTILALEYNSSKYDFVEKNLKLEERQVSLISTTQDHVTNLQTEDSLYLINNTTLAARLEVSWEKPRGAARYKISWTLGDGNSDFALTIGTSYEILNVPVGSYSVTVIAYSSLGTASLPVTLLGTTLGITVTPSDVSNFTIIVNGLTSFLSWDAVTEANLAYYQIRFSPDVVGATWEDSTLLVERVSKDSTSASVPTLLGTYFIKTVSISGTFNPTATSVVQSASPAGGESGTQGYNLVETFNEDPGFDGVVDEARMYVNSGSIIYQYELATPGDVKTATATVGKTFSVATQTSDADSVEFNVNGTRMYVIARGSTIVYQYDLGTAWDVSTAVYNSVNYDTTTQTTTTSALSFSPDGLRMFVLDDTGDIVYKYDIPTAWDISSIAGFVTGDLFNVSGKVTTPTGINFSVDGTKLYVVGITFDTVYMWNIPTAWDISSITTWDTGDDWSVATQDIAPREVNFSSDGTTMYVAGDNTDYVYMYDVPTPWDIASITTFVGGDLILVSSQTTTLRGLTFSRPYVKVDGSTLKLSNPSVVPIAEYNFFNTVDLGATYPAQFVIDLDVSAQTIGSLMADWTTLNSVTILSGTIVDPSLASVDLKIRDTIDDPAVSPTWSAWRPFLVGDYNARAFEFKACLSTQDSNVTPLVTGLDIYLSMVDRILSDAGIQSIAGDEFNTKSTANGSRALYISPDGYYMFVQDATNRLVVKYDLTKAWEVTTANFTSGDVFDHTTEVTGITGLSFSSDGKKMFLIGNQPAAGRTVMYDLNPAWDIQSAGFTALDYYDVTEDTAPQDITFNSAGDMMFIIGTNNTVYSYDLTVDWEVTIGGVTYTNESKYVGNEITGSKGLTFSPDGFYMYVIGSVDDEIYEYILSTAWDLTTAIYTSGDFYNVEYQHETPQSLAIHPSGSKIYVIGSDGSGKGRDKVTGHTMATPWDIKTSSYEGIQHVTSVTNEETIPESLVFSTNGMMMFVLGNISKTIFMYNLSIAWDVNTAVYSGDSVVVLEDTRPTAFQFNPDGTMVFVLGTTDRTVRRYDLSPAWDITSLSLVVNSYYTILESQPQGLVFNPTGTKMLIAGLFSNTIFDYDLGTAWDVSTASPSGNNKSFIAQSNKTTDLAVSPDGKDIYIVDNTTQVRIFQYTMGTPWYIKSAVYTGILNITPETAEPSGIFFKTDGSKLYVLSDDYLDTVVQYSLSEPWQVSFATATGSEIVYSLAFHITPSIAIASHNLSQGDFYEISNKTLAGFHLVFKNVDNRPVSRTFDYIAKGY